MMDLVVIVVFGALTMLCANRFSTPAYRQRILLVIGGSFLLRVALNAFIVRSISFFSHGQIGGDCGMYELVGIDIAEIWEHDGIQWVTRERYPHLLGLTGIELVVHFLGAIIYICGGKATVACTAGVAFFACMLCLLVFHFARMLGASEAAGFKAMVITIVSPAFLYHTSDTYKDGLNAFLVISTVCLAVSISRKFAPWKVLLIAPILWGLWHIRPYMVFMSLTPLPIGFIGLRKGDVGLTTRNIVSLIVLGVASLAFVSMGASNSVVAAAQEQWDRGLSTEAREYNQYTGGSGVSFNDGGNAFGSLGAKLLYTVAAPFPWMGGSFGLQIGKVDTFIWYYILFSAFQAAKLMWRRDKPSLLMLLAFIGPATIAYSLTVANVGLILRQRIPIVIATTILASVYWSHQYELRRRVGAVLPTRRGPAALRAPAGPPTVATPRALAPRPERG